MSFTFVLLMLFLLGVVATVGIAVAVFRYFHLRGLDKQALDAIKADVQNKVNKL
jgi:hypothetical protein